jgi:hypothetical protein
LSIGWRLIVCSFQKKEKNMNNTILNENFDKKYVITQFVDLLNKIIEQKEQQDSELKEVADNV